MPSELELAAAVFGTGEYYLAPRVQLNPAAVKLILPEGNFGHFKIYYDPLPEGQFYVFSKNLVERVFFRSREWNHPAAAPAQKLGVGHLEVQFSQRVAYVPDVHPQLKWVAGFGNTGSGGNVSRGGLQFLREEVLAVYSNQGERIL
jgi:hypothetical protein